MQISLFNVRRVENFGNVRAFLSIQIGEITIHGCKIVQQPGQRAWLSMPDRQWTDENGAKRYSPVVELTNNLKKHVSDTTLAEWGTLNESAA